MPGGGPTDEHTIGPQRLPPLNPMRRAPQTGEEIIIMMPDGTIKVCLWQGGSWWGSSRGLILNPLFVVFDQHCLGWWPIPEAAQ